MPAKVDIELCRRAAEKHGGQCLCTKYVSSQESLHWRCVDGHEWWASWNTVQQGHWCSMCARERTNSAVSTRRIGIERCKQWALERGGDCLSKEYVNSKTKLRWLCRAGHEWDAVWDSIKQGHWCPVCAAEKLGIAYGVNIDDCRRIAAERGYRCLSDKYVNDKTSLIWQCISCGREWKACLGSIKRGSGCPHCHTNDMENRCRVIFETVFGKPFLRCKPFKPVSLLELDGYNSELLLSFEYDGIQHRIGNWIRRQSPSPLISMRDRKKNELCKQNGICLIRINDLEATRETLVDVIIDKLNEEEVAFPRPSNETLSELRKPLNLVYKRIWVEGYIERFRELCSSHLDPTTGRRGELLHAEVWLGNAYNYDIRCERGHLFKGNYGNTRKGHWCQKCANDRIKVGIERCKFIAKEYDGECLSKEYIDSREKLLWRCKDGHEFPASYNSVQQGHWCPDCEYASRRGRRLSEETRRKLRGRVPWNKGLIGGHLSEETRRKMKGRVPWNKGRRRDQDKEG